MASKWNEETVLELLRSINVPGQERNIVDYGMVQALSVNGNKVTVRLEVFTRDDVFPEQVRAAVDKALRDKCFEPVIELSVKRFGGLGNAQPAGASTRAAAPMGPHGTSPDPWADRQRLEGVRWVVAVASGKGGVGKSTVAVNLAVALAKQGLEVGLLDADIYGPSQPIMLGIADVDITADQHRRIIPVEAHGIRTISMGYLIHDDQPVIWRGPLVMKTIEQFLRGVAWGKLDVLVVDLPPGTGDAQLSLVQKTPIDGAVIVTTPQKVALADVIRGHAMFENVGVPTLGVVENMSYFITPDGSRHEIFGHGGGRESARERGITFLGEIPLDPAVREGGDAGTPIVAVAPHSPAGKAFLDLATAVMTELNKRGQKD